MTKRACLALLVSLTIVVTASDLSARSRSVQRQTPALLTAIDAIAANALQDGVPGLVIAVSREGRVVLERAYGVQNLSTRVPVETNTIFQVASVTKQFTAALIMKLVERDQLDLGADIRSILPELDTGDAAVTVDHLLTHTSGLPNYLEAQFDPHEPVTHAEVLAAINAAAMRFEPGARWEYNNSGYYLLGVIIERVSGVSYDAFLEAELLRPLGLVESAYCGNPPAFPVPNGYVRLGPLSPISFEAMDMTIPFAAGALCSTAEDLVRWSWALDQGLAITPESYEAMTTEAVLSSGEGAGYGYGIGVGEFNGEPVFSHTGGIPGFSSFLIIAPERGVSIAVITNLFSTEESVATEIALEVAEVVAAEFFP